MSEIKFSCPECGQKISCESSYSGTSIPCPTCHKSLTVPAATAGPAPGPISLAPMPPLGQTVAPPLAANSLPQSPPPPSSAPPQPAPAEKKVLPTPKHSFWEEASAGQKPAAAAALREPPPSATGYSILAIASFFCSLWVGFGTIPGIICGHLAKARLRANPMLEGEGFAKAGLAISYAVLAVFLLVGGTFFAMAHHFKPVIVVRESPDDLKALTPRVVDEVIPGPSAPAGANENEHNVMGRGPTRTGPYAGKYFRDAFSGGGFTYDMKVLPYAAMSLNCRFWGNEGDGQ